MLRRPPRSVGRPTTFVVRPASIRISRKRVRAGYAELPGRPRRSPNSRPMNAPLAIAHTESSMGWGGQEIRTLTEAAGFLRRGHRVVVYAAPGSRIAAEAPRFGVPLVALPIGRKRLRGVRSLVGAFAGQPPDVVNAHSSTDAWLDALACAWLARTSRAAPVLVRTRHVS